MKLFTPANQSNLKWSEENEGKLLAEYNGKFVLIYNCKVVAWAFSQEELIKKAEQLGITEENSIIVGFGSAIIHDIIEMG